MKLVESALRSCAHNHLVVVDDEAYYNLLVNSTNLYILVKSTQTCYTIDRRILQDNTHLEDRKGLKFLLYFLKFCK